MDNTRELMSLDEIQEHIDGCDSVIAASGNGMVYIDTMKLIALCETALAAHKLKERVEELEEAYRLCDQADEGSQEAYNLMRGVVEIQQKENAQWRALAKSFIDKVDSGKARSTDTYSLMKEILAGASNGN